MKKFNYISRYDSAREILDEFCGPDFWDGINDEDECFLDHFDDFEGYAYYAIDNQIVVTMFPGEVIATYDNFNDYLSAVMELLEEDRGERE